MPNIPTSPLLKRLFASAPTDLYAVPAMILKANGMPDIRLCHSYENLYLPVRGEWLEFEASQFSLKRENKDTRGAQNISFGFAGITSAALKYVSDTLRNATPVRIEIFEFIGRKNGGFEVGRQYREIEAKGGQADGDQIVIDAAYNEILTRSYPNVAYNTDNAPGIRYV